VKKKSLLTALSLPTEKISPYPWLLISWPIEKEAIGKLRELRQQWKKKNPIVSKLYAKRFEQRGRPRQSSPLYTEQSFVLAFAHTELNVRRADLLRALGKNTTPEDYHWLKIRLKRGQEHLLNLSPQDLKFWKSVDKETLLDHLQIFP